MQQVRELAELRLLETSRRVPTILLVIFGLLALILIGLFLVEATRVYVLLVRVACESRARALRRNARLHGNQQLRILGHVTLLVVVFTEGVESVGLNNMLVDDEYSLRINVQQDRWTELR